MSKKKYIWIAIVVLFVIIVAIIITKPKTIEEVKDSVVKIVVYNENNKEKGTGSGFCAYYKNYIVTNYHVIAGAYDIKIIDDNNQLANVIDVVIFDANDDLAILEVDKDFEPIKLGSSNYLEAGQAVTAIGSPQGVLNTVSTGIVSNADDEEYIRFTAPISPGSSGGVLLNSNNKVIGITTATYNSLEAQNINFARSVEKLESLYSALKKGEYAIIDNSNKSQCLPGIFGHNNTEALQIGCCDFTGYKRYTTKTIKDFYLATDSLNIFEMSLKDKNDSFSTIYNQMTEKEKALAATYFDELLEFETCYDWENCKKDDNIDSFNSWSIYQYILELDILERYEFAIFLVEIQNYQNSDEIFDFVDSLDIDVGQKMILLIKVCNYDFNYIHVDDKEYLFDFLDVYIDNVEFMGMILKDLGYGVTYNSDGTLTANW